MRIHHTKPRKRHAADCSEGLFGVGVTVVVFFVAIGVIAWAIAKIGGM